MSPFAIGVQPNFVKHIPWPPFVYSCSVSASAPCKSSLLTVASRNFIDD
jgi:hypothetical protein